jgi:hypothetical protein
MLEDPSPSASNMEIDKDKKKQQQLAASGELFADPDNASIDVDAAKLAGVCS